MISSFLNLVDRKKAARRRRLAQRAAMKAVEAFPLTSEKRAHGLPGPLVVSLTSYSKRFSTLSYTIKSLLDQDIAIDQVILWLGRDDVALLPPEVRGLESPYFSVRGTKDIRSYTKLIPALKERPEAFIITADDDIYYPASWARMISDGYIPQQRMTVSRRAHMACVDVNGSAMPYASWPHTVGAESDPGAGQALFPTGVGGVLYPPGIFEDEVFNEEAFLELCPFADDLWFFWMQLIGDVKRRRVGPVEKFITWPASQATGLLNENLHLGRNDSQLAALERRYGKLERFIGRLRIPTIARIYSDLMPRSVPI
jgi:hypothetical protein